MTNTQIAAPLAAALAARGYENLTAVQQAVLNTDALGRDLLVSAQTGSGKTVAFGIAAAPELLADGDTLPDDTPPLALAIAPTRELALQVAAELGWLYASTGARIATCVGGMDYRTERRALARGAHIVVGTPGRLRDHIERGALDLSALRVAVLDEADEMLDLGFREDLEAILQAAPESRRTLMFSATVPGAIEKLARDFQRDSLRIAAMGEARQHGDIAYRALSIAVRDRENAIFNLLRYYEARTAIVFCKTRANVSHLLARMGNRGFRVVALSGELSQQERTHALQALRDGRARVCIATDVAARGIDLPGLELVIHADLPTNYETLLHRSGRTGRAGAKGVSALIVTPADYKKAQRLLQGAKVVAEWGKAPSAEEVSARDDVRMLDHPALTTALDDMTIAQDLLARVGPEQVAAAFVQLWREGRPPPEELTDSAPMSEAAPRAPREFGRSVWFTLSVGHTGRAEARWLLPKICEAGQITRDSIGAIRIREDETFVQIAVAEAHRFGDLVEIEPELLMRRLNGVPSLDRPSGPRPSAPRGPKPGGKPYAKSPARASEDGAELGFAKREFPKRDGARKDVPKKDGAKSPRKYAGKSAETPQQEFGETFGARFGDKPFPKPRKSAVAADEAPAKGWTPDDSDAPRKKARWSAEEKAAKSRKDAPARDGKPFVAKGKPRAGAKPAGTKPAGGKPESRGPAPRRGSGGNAAPRRPKARS
ncbi:DEAD/DEAH box helicase [Paracoccus sp. DMF-8]|uniref:DEAD/DEAH box helicase n=1 Tax=Paracoccus sp. DMF-8 TaxID=3019445 RepID=UPI0023E8DC84|nr:DEAD/DEAH box helicase [Paracoccus sp. DMF-8]MDF3605007.1 DEAD/DEAH box helicase [Paracoccus sp. DMF-8]